jgi:hypothetical protein
MNLDAEIEAMLGPLPAPRFVIFSSYGNDSVALIQWAHEQGLRGVSVVYSDTQWAAPWWEARVVEMEAWVRRLGFRPARTTSIGFVELARQKKGFPTQRYQWCSYILKIEPGERWLAENDPDARAVCLVGVRRDEGPDRAEFPRYDIRSGNHGDRVMIAPFVDFTGEQRDELLFRAGIEPLPHRSMECSPCINSNKVDLKALTEDSISAVERLEGEMGMTSKGKPRTLFRPHRHMGAVGIREVVKWAHSPHGKYLPPAGVAIDLEDPDAGLPERDLLTCNNGYCSN